MKHVLPIFFFLLFALASKAQQTAKPDLSIFPNPAVDYISVQDNNDVVGKVAVFNLVGKKMKDFAFAKDEHFYIADLPKGMYLVQIIGKNSKVISTQKINKR